MAQTGTGASRFVSPAIFANARRYHTGGLPGLKADDIPAILKRNEEVLKEDDPRNVLNGGKADQNGKQSGNLARAIRNILVFDPADIAGAMASSAGDDVMINFVKRNAQTVRRILG
jgi:hypothetical protein